MGKASVRAKLKTKGFSDKAIAAIMGNMQQESGFSSINVEDRYHRDTGGTDEQYTAAVDNGSYTRNDFEFDGGKAYGYGLCQWTFHTRKAGLWDFARMSRKSIGDEQMQVDWFVSELNQPEFKSVLKSLKSNDSLAEMTKKFMVIYENPDDKSDNAINYRVGLAEALYREFSGTEPEPVVDTQVPEPGWEKIPATSYWPPRTICEGMIGKDVVVLRALLYARGFDIDVDDDEFDIALKDCVLNYQNAYGLDVDGIVGPLTWGELLNRG